MKSTTGDKIIFAGVMLITLTSVLVAAVSPRTDQKNESSKERTTNQETAQPTVREAQQQSSPFNLIYHTREGETTKIFAVNQDGGDPKLLYTDTKDQEKFKAVAGLRNDGSLIYLVVASPGQEFAGKLIQISTDGKAKSATLREEVKFTTVPQVSPTGDKLAQIIFSNDEKNFGFTVTLENLDSSNANSVYKSEETISLVDFSGDGKKLVVLKSSPSGGAQIVVVDLADNSSKGIYSTPGAILSLDFDDTGFVIAQSPSGTNKANETELIKIDADGKNVTKITTNNFAENSLKFDPDEKQVAYIQLNYPDGLASPGVTGNLVKINLETKNEAIIGKAVGVIGWTQ